MSLKKGQDILSNKIDRQEDTINRELVLLSNEKSFNAEKDLDLKFIKRGDGYYFPKDGDKVSITYTGKLENGKVFDSTIGKGKLFSFYVGKNQVIKGLDLAIKKMSRGSRAIITIPSQLAYGKKGAGNGIIPPNSDLIFDVRLIIIIPSN